MKSKLTLSITLAITLTLPAKGIADDIAEKAGCININQTPLEYLTSLFNQSSDPTALIDRHCRMKIEAYKYGKSDTDYRALQADDAGYRSATISTVDAQKNIGADSLYVQENAAAELRGDENKRELDISTLKQSGYRSVTAKEQ